MIEIHRAHIHWDKNRKAVLVSEFLSSEDRTANRTFASDTGASWSTWKDQTADRLVQNMVELAFELIALHGFPLPEVLQEFMKVREFRQAGSQSYYLARLFSFAESGQISEDLERWSGE